MPLNGDMFSGILEAKKDKLSDSQILERIASKHQDVATGIQEARQDKLNDSEILRRIFRKSQQLHREDAVKRAQLGVGTRTAPTKEQLIRSNPQKQISGIRSFGQGLAMPMGVEPSAEAIQQHPIATTAGGVISTAAQIVPAVYSGAMSLARGVEEFSVGQLAKAGLSNGLIGAGTQGVLSKSIGRTWKETAKDAVNSGLITGALGGLGRVVEPKIVLKGTTSVPEVESYMKTGKPDLLPRQMSFGDLEKVESSQAAKIAQSEISSEARHDAMVPDEHGIPNVTGISQADRLTPTTPKFEYPYKHESIDELKTAFSQVASNVRTASDSAVDVTGWTPNQAFLHHVGQENMINASIKTLDILSKQFSKKGMEPILTQASKFSRFGESGFPEAYPMAKAIASMYREQADFIYSTVKQHGVEMPYRENYITNAVVTSREFEAQKTELLSKFTKPELDERSASQLEQLFHGDFDAFQKHLDDTYGPGKFKVVDNLLDNLAMYQKSALKAMQGKDLERILSNVRDNSTGLTELLYQNERDDLLRDTPAGAIKDEILKYRAIKIKSFNQPGDTTVYLSPRTASIGEQFFNPKNTSPFWQTAKTLNRAWKEARFNFSLFHGQQMAKSLLTSGLNPSYPLLIRLMDAPLRPIYSPFRLMKGWSLLQDSDFVRTMRMEGAVKEFNLDNAGLDLVNRLRDQAFGKSLAGINLRKAFGPTAEAALGKVMDGLGSVWHATGKLTFNNIGRMAEAWSFADDVGYFSKRMPKGTSRDIIMKSAGDRTSFTFGTMMPEFTNKFVEDGASALIAARRWLASNIGQAFATLKGMGVNGLGLPSVKTPFEIAGKQRKLGFTMGEAVGVLGGNVLKDEAAFKQYGDRMADLLVGGYLSTLFWASFFKWKRTGKMAWEDVDFRDPQAFEKMFSVPVTVDGRQGSYNFLGFLSDPVRVVDGIRAVVQNGNLKPLESFARYRLSYVPNLIATATEDLHSRKRREEDFSKSLEGSAVKVAAPIWGDNYLSYRQQGLSDEEAKKWAALGAFGIRLTLEPKPSYGFRGRIKL